jgi:uncharacterized protein YjbJ (UPF0337 family)
MSGFTDKITGKLKQVEGTLTGDKVRVAQGTVEKAKGDLESAAARIARTAKRAIRRIARRTKA